MAKRKPAQSEPRDAMPTTEPPIAATEQNTASGNIPPVPAATDPAAVRACASAVSMRLAKEGRWSGVGGVQAIRDDMIRKAKQQGMSVEDARAWVYPELDRLYPPLGQPQPSEPSAPPTLAREATVSGLGDIPWDNLPANASLAAEIAWVQAERLYIVEETSSGATKVNLSAAHSPPPSRAALGWLETSIRSYAKFIDVAARATSQQQDEAEHVRRERLAIDDIRALLAEMKPVCPHCGGSLM